MLLKFQLNFNCFDAKKKLIFFISTGILPNLLLRKAPKGISHTGKSKAAAPAHTWNGRFGFAGKKKLRRTGGASC